MAANEDTFSWQTFDDGYVSFVFDDLRHDIDKIAAIFEEYEYPLCIAAIPAALSFTADGLTEENGSFQPNMMMRDVCTQVEENGGEIMTHNISVITNTTQENENFLYNYYILAKQVLEGEGYTIRGIIRAGGEGQIDRSSITEAWAYGNYDYSDFGYTPQHQLDRITLNQEVTYIKTHIDRAKENHTWIRFMGHDFEYGNGFSFKDENDLREILDYCQYKEINVVTYAYMYDNFGS